MAGKWKQQAKLHVGSKFSTFVSQRAEQTDTCMDTENGAADRDGDVCWQYGVYPQWCGGDYDDDDFMSATMCCACGGGHAASAPANSPLPEQQPYVVQQTVWWPGSTAASPHPS